MFVLSSAYISAGGKLFPGPGLIQYNTSNSREQFQISLTTTVTKYSSLRNDYWWLNIYTYSSNLQNGIDI